MSLERICLALIIAIIAPGQSDAASANLYSVCQVLSKARELNGTTVAVRGVLVSGEHGSYLSGGCTIKAAKTEFKWPGVIWLVNPIDADGHRTEVDPQAHAKVRHIISKWKPTGDKYRIVLTYIGVVASKNPDVDFRTDRYGQFVPFGFGPDLDALVQLTDDIR